LRVPVVDAKGPVDILDPLVALGLSIVGLYPVHGTKLSDLIHQIPDITGIGVSSGAKCPVVGGPANEKLGCSGPIIDSRRAAIDCIRGYIFVSSWDIQDGVGRHDLTSKCPSLSGALGSILSGSIESSLDGLIGNSWEEPPECGCALSLDLLDLGGNSRTGVVLALLLDRSGSMSASSDTALTFGLACVEGGPEQSSQHLMTKGLPKGGAGGSAGAGVWPGFVHGIAMEYQDQEHNRHCHPRSLGHNRGMPVL
ncbi:hypothetical protein (Partial), partial [Seminavis robusta]